MKNVNLNENQLLELAVNAAFQGGLQILDVYNSGFDVELKSDHTPLTQADLRAHETIKSVLSDSHLPVLSEEGREIPYEERKDWNLFWMVDPLDGTKEFVKRNGEFTVNIALIENGQPKLGIIYVPVLDVLFFGGATCHSVKCEKFSKVIGFGLQRWMAMGEKLPRKIENRPFTVVGSRSHKSVETEEYMNQLEKDHSQIENVSMGSSLKICLVAEGVADVYPRFAPTMEWDTAAGHGIALGSGKNIFDQKTGKPMVYNKINLLNNSFIVE